MHVNIYLFLIMRKTNEWAWWRRGKCGTNGCNLYIQSSSLLALYLPPSRTKWFSFIFSILIHPKNSSFAYKLFLTKCVSTSRKSYLISPQSAYHHSLYPAALSLSHAKPFQLIFKYLFCIICIFLLVCWKTQHHKMKERKNGSKKKNNVKSEREWGKMVFKKQNIWEKKKEKRAFLATSCWKLKWIGNFPYYILIRESTYIHIYMSVVWKKY